MTQRDRDRLVVLRKAEKRLITQAQAAEEVGLTARHVRRLLKRLKKEGDSAVIHKLRGSRSNRKLDDGKRQEILQFLSQPVYRGFGPTLAREYLAREANIHVGRETLRQIMLSAGLWRARKRRIEKSHPWRERRRCLGELVQWDTSEHDWLEGRGPKLYLIHMIDDAASRLRARFVAHDSTEENMGLLWEYLVENGRPCAFYTDKASLFQTAPKVARDRKMVPREEREAMPPTQIGRALQELQIAWIAAHSPQAKGRVERSFATAQDRLVKGLRVAGVATLEAANQYLREEFLPWWNQHLAVIPSSPADAHRPLGSEHNLAAILSHVEPRTVGPNYTISIGCQPHRIQNQSSYVGLRGAVVHVQWRLDGTMAVRFRDQYLDVVVCPQQPKVGAATPKKSKPVARKPRTPSPAARAAIDGLFKRSSPPMWQASQINRTRTRQKLD